MINIIVAMTKDQGIGYNNKLPWYIPDDLKRFKKLTSNSVIVMGRKTWDSLPIKPLPNRINYVLSKNQVITEPGKPGVMSFSNESLLSNFCPILY